MRCGNERTDTAVHAHADLRQHPARAPRAAQLGYVVAHVEAEGEEVRQGPLFAKDRFAGIFDVRPHAPGEAAFHEFLRTLLANLSGLPENTVEQRLDMERLAAWLNQLA